MADFVTRSQVAIHDWSHVYGNGYAPEYFGGTSRFRISRTAITKMASNAMLGECTFTVVFDSNQTDDPPAQRNSGYNYAIDYEIWIDGVMRGSTRLVSRTQYINKDTRYTRTIRATGIPLDARTTRPAYIRTVNDRPSSQALLFDSRNQGGDSLGGFPLGVERSTFASFSSFTMTDSATTISASVTRKTTGVTHNISLIHSGTTIASWNAQNNITSLSLTQTQTRTLLSRIKTANSATVTLRVQTMYGGSAIYSQDRTATATVGIPPTIGSVSITDSSGALTAVGALVQGISNVTLNINSAVAGYGATVSSYGMTWAGTNRTGLSSPTFNAGIVTVTGSQAFEGRMQNSRGSVAKKTATYTVLPWAPPTSTNLSIVRANSSGSPSSTGTYIRVSGTHNVSPLNHGGSNKNTLRVQVEYRERGVTAWTNMVNKTYPAGSAWTSEVHTGGGGNISALKSYEVRVTLADRFSDHVVEGSVSSERVPFSVGKTGVGVGKIWEKDALEVFGNSHLDGNVFAGGRVDAVDGYRVNGNMAIDETGKFYVRDTRSINTPTDNGVGFDVEFKSTSAIGLTGVDSYAIVHTFQGWRDASGGNIHQLAFTATRRGSKTGKIFYRTTPTGNASWGSWVELPTGSSGGGGDGGVVTSFSSSINGTLYQAMEEAYSAGAFPSGRSFQMMFKNAGSIYSFQGNRDHGGRVYGLLLSSMSRRIVTRTSTGSWGIVNITTTAF